MTDPVKIKTNTWYVICEQRTNSTMPVHIVINSMVSDYPVVGIAYWGGSQVLLRFTNGGLPKAPCDDTLMRFGPIELSKLPPQPATYPELAKAGCPFRTTEGLPVEIVHTDLNEGNMLVVLSKKLFYEVNSDGKTLNSRSELNIAPYLETRD